MVPGGPLLAANAPSAPDFWMKALHRSTRLLNIGRHLLITATVAASYYLAARWGLLFGLVHGNVTLVWPPTGIALAAVLLRGYRVLPGVALGAYLATASTGVTPLFALATAIGNPLAAFATAALLRRWLDFHSALDRVRDVLSLACVAAPLGAAVGAVLGVSGLCLFGLAPWASFSHLAASWWLGDAMGVLLVAPVLLTWTAHPQARAGLLRRAPEAVAFLGLLVVVSGAVFGLLPLGGDPRLLHSYLLLPFFVVAAFRYGPTGSATTALIVSAAAITGVVEGLGGDERILLQERLALALGFTSVFTLASLMLAAVVAERDGAARALRSAHAGLEMRVADRTVELRHTNLALERQIAELHQARAALRQTTSTLHSILRSASEYAIAAVDRDYRVLHFNPAAAQLFGYPAEAVVGRTLREIHAVAGVDGRRLDAAIATVMADGKWEATFPLRRSDGQAPFVHAVVMPMHDEDAALTGFVLFARDVTAQCQSEELARAQRNLALALCGTNDLDTALRLCVETALRVADMDAGGVYLLDSLHGGFELAFHTGMPPEFIAQIRRFEAGSPGAQIALAAEPVYTTYSALAAKLDHSIPDAALGAFAMIPICDEDRVIATLDLVSRRSESVPPSARHALETIAAQTGGVLVRLRAEAERLRLAAAVEQAAETIIVTDLDGRIQYANPAFERITGYTCAEVVGRSPSLLRSGQHDAAFYRGLWDTLTRGETWTGRFQNRRKDGTLYHEDATISPVRDVSGKITHYVAVKRDVTREVTLEAQLRESQTLDAVGRLAGGVAHEFNNVLTAILGYSEIIAADVSPEHPVAEHAARIKRATERAAQLVRQLLALGRREVVQPRSLCLNQVVTDTLRKLRPALGEHIQVETLLDPGLGLVRADPGQMELLLTNLSMHAREAMPQGGKLTIETTSVTLDDGAADALESVAPGRYVTLAVRDTGPGMDAETRAHLFEPFFMTHDAAPSAGLGLATVHSIVRQHGGRIVVHSVPGQGTTLRVYLPRQGDRLEPAAPGAAPDETRRTGATILLAEDEEEVRTVIRDILVAEGHTVLTAGHAPAALELAHNFDGRIDLLVSDVVMPGMSGRELAERLLATRPGMKVLYISGYAASFLSTHGQLGDGVAFLAKPFTRSILAGKVRAILGEPPPRHAAPAHAASVAQAQH